MIVHHKFHPAKAGLPIHRELQSNNFHQIVLILPVGSLEEMSASIDLEKEKSSFSISQTDKETAGSCALYKGYNNYCNRPN